MARPAKKYSEDVARQVEEMRTRGVSIADISLLVGMSEKTLRKVYSREIDTGIAIANYQVGNKIFELAMAGSVACLIFWAKTRMGWSEKPKEAGPDVEALRKGIASAFDSVGGNEQQSGVLVTPGILTEEEWQRAANSGNPPQ